MSFRHLANAETKYGSAHRRIGHGGSSKPSDGLRARFPRDVYADMVEAEYRLVTDGRMVWKW